MRGIGRSEMASNVQHARLQTINNNALTEQSPGARRSHLAPLDPPHPALRATFPREGGRGSPDFDQSRPLNGASRRARYSFNAILLVFLIHSLPPLEVCSAAIASILYWNDAARPAIICC